jgi:hypothetical protein
MDTFRLSLRRVLSVTFRPDLFHKKQLKMTIMHESSWVTAVLVALKEKVPHMLPENKISPYGL